jgi:hypothetical protein
VLVLKRGSLETAVVPALAIQADAALKRLLRFPNTLALLWCAAARDDDHGESRAAENSAQTLHRRSLFLSRPGAGAPGSAGPHRECKAGARSSGRKSSALAGSDEVDALPRCAGWASLAQGAQRISAALTLL